MSFFFFFSSFRRPDLEIFLKKKQVLNHYNPPNITTPLAFLLAHVLAFSHMHIKHKNMKSSLFLVVLGGYWIMQTTLPTSTYGAVRWTQHNRIETFSGYILQAWISQQVQGKWDALLASTQKYVKFLYYNNK